MAVQTAFISCVPGQWTQLCEYRETRTALMVQLIGGFAVLSPTTAGPTVTNTYGTMPAGFFHSTEFGMGPDVFEVYKTAEDDIVRQIWYAWVPIVNAPAPPSWVTSTFSGTNSQAVAGPSSAACVALMMVFAGTGITFATVTCPRLGTISNVIGPLPLQDAGGDWCTMYIYVDTSPGGDVYTITGDNATSANVASIAWFPAGAIDDAGLGTVLATATITQTTAGTLQLAGEWLVTFAIAQDAVTVASVAGDITSPVTTSGQLVSPFPITWTWTATAGQALLPGTTPVITLTWSAPATQTAWRMESRLPAAATAIPVITVTESFTVPAMDDPHWIDPTKKISARLPKLSRKGIRALHALLEREKLKNGNPDAKEE